VVTAINKVIMTRHESCLTQVELSGIGCMMAGMFSDCGLEGFSKCKESAYRFKILGRSPFVVEGVRELEGAVGRYIRWRIPVLS